MDRKEAERLLEKYTNGTATPEERHLIENWYEEEASRRILSDDDGFEHLDAELWAGTRERAGLMPERPVRRLWTRIAAAASILIALSAGGYFLLRQQKAEQPRILFAKNDIAPGHHQATLTLANGKKIVLTRGLQGLLARQGQTSINVSQNDLTYSRGEQTEQVTYNTMSTAKGEQSPYPLILADGTKVWLNAASSITFPTTFNSSTRNVKITGEALFEVAHNAKQPFKVEVRGQVIEDIGTRFDVNAYDDEPGTKTTLIEGSVRVSVGGNSTSKILQPGQQANVNKNSSAIEVTQVKTADVVAWQQGYFRCSKTELSALMREVARWYDVDVVYQGNTGLETYSGTINRNDSLTKLLSVLGHGDVHYRIEGKKLILLP